MVCALPRCKNGFFQRAPVRINWRRANIPERMRTASHLERNLHLSPRAHLSCATNSGGSATAAASLRALCKIKSNAVYAGECFFPEVNALLVLIKWPPISILPSKALPRWLRNGRCILSKHERNDPKRSFLLRALCSLRKSTFLSGKHFNCVSATSFLFQL